ncbi:MAG: hypothetical protein KIG36_00260 [Eubacteriales bacterium]|nr:hypothetical protein [Eubacteriales bacterium]
MSANAIKLIAAILMALSHLGNVFGGALPPALTRTLIVIGRPAFPIFAYFLAEGWHHTRSKEKYLLRLAVFAVLSQPFFWYGFFRGEGFLSHWSTIATLFVAAAVLYCWEKARSGRLWWLIPCAAALAVPFVTTTDYGFLGALTAVTLFFIRDKRIRLAALGLFCCAIYLRGGFGLWPVIYAGTACLAILPLSFYNGQKGFALPRYWFYIFYPLHIAVYIAVRAALGL